MQASYVSFLDLLVHVNSRSIKIVVAFSKKGSKSILGNANSGMALRVALRLKKRE